MIKRDTLVSGLLASSVFGASMLGVVMALALPFILPKEEYSLFVLNMSLAQLVSSLGFEWLRVSILRFGDRQRSEFSHLRGVILILYTWLIGILLTLGMILAVVALRLPSIWPAALICATAAMQGMFDGRSAQARSNFENLRLSFAALARSVFGLILVLGLASITKSGLWSLVGLSCSFPLATFPFRSDRSGLPLFRLVTLDYKAAKQAVAFGAMAGIGTNISLAVPVALRSIIVAQMGLAGASGQIFALEISQRIFATTGMAFNLLHLQALIRTIDSEAPEVAIAKARKSISLQTVLFMAMVTMVLTAAAPVAALLAPTQYRDDFSSYLPSFALLLAILSLRQYAVDPIFIAFRRVRYIAVAPAITLVLFGLANLLVVCGIARKDQLLDLLIFSAAIGFVVPFLLMLYWIPRVLPWPAFMASGVAFMIASSVMPTIDIGRVPAGFAAVLEMVISGGLFLAIAVGLMDVFGLLRGWFSRTSKYGRDDVD